jgi:hypothetical protein
VNQFFLDTRLNEKVRDALEEGMRNQAVHRSGRLKPSLRRRLSGIILSFAVIVSLMNVLLK